MTESDKIITLTGRRGAAWGSSSSFARSGTIEDWQIFFRENMSTGYSVNYRELVPPEFFYQIGGTLFTQLEYNDLLTVTGTIAALNKQMSNTGRPQFTPQDKLHQALTIIESEEFASALPEDRLNMLGEELGLTSVWIAGSNFMPKRDIYLFAPQYNFREKYPELEPKIAELWQQEVCEKSIDLYLATL